MCLNRTRRLISAFPLRSSNPSSSLNFSFIRDNAEPGSSSEEEASPVAVTNGLSDQSKRHEEEYALWRVMSQLHPERKVGNHSPQFNVRTFFLMAHDFAHSRRCVLSVSGAVAKAVVIALATI
jgi:hypothetical protein